MAGDRPSGAKLPRPRIIRLQGSSHSRVPALSRFQATHEVRDGSLAPPSGSVSKLHVTGQPRMVKQG